jgi:selenide,water dikinase
LGPRTLAQVLQPLKSIFPSADFPSVLRGLDRPDDAAAMKLDDGRIMVVSADFFPPVVNDPYDYGAIAAANALSDIYAMGASPVLAVNLAAFPDDMDEEIIASILRGGGEKVREAGAVIAGGHTTVDREPKYGLAVIGFVGEGQLLTNEGARPGDILYLTKPIGTGVLATAHKNDAIDDADFKNAVESMLRLNAGAAKILRENAGHVHAATDVTGFSLAGHAHELAHLSEVSLRIAWDCVPLLPEAENFASRGIVTGGGTRNRDYYGSWLDDRKSLTEAQDALLYDPQTSGGLLVAIDGAAAEALEANFAGANEPFWRVGHVVQGEAGRIIIE